jgi:F0F1-type ATP synthase membrane subunit b/b'
MCRTTPSFRIALAMEKAYWKPFRNALDKSINQIENEI